MMLDRDALERQLFDQFLEALKRLPKVRATLGSLLAFDDPNRGVDACVELWVGEQTTTLQIEVKKAIYPRDVRQAVRQYQERVRRWPQSSEGRRGLPFLLAQSISPGAKDLLRDERVGYFDSGGSLFLPADSIYVYIEKPPPKAFSKSIRS